MLGYCLVFCDDHKQNAGCIRNVMLTTRLLKRSRTHCHWGQWVAYNQAVVDGGLEDSISKNMGANSQPLRFQIFIFWLTFNVPFEVSLEFLSHTPAILPPYCNESRWRWTIRGCNMIHKFFGSGCKVHLFITHWQFDTTHHAGYCSYGRLC